MQPIRVSKSASIAISATASILFILVTALTIGVGAQSKSAKQPAEIAREQGQAVVLLEPLDDQGRSLGQGSGFIVTPSGAIVTNLHVIQGATSVRVKLPSGDVYQCVDVVDADQLKDIAVIKVRGFQLPVVTMGNSDASQIGDAIVAISSPQGLTNSLTTGVISGIRRLDTHRVFQITAPIAEGSSGGALFDGNGAVIGITTYILRSGQNINFALPINYVRGMISDKVTSTMAALPVPSAPRPNNGTAAAPEAALPPEADINPASRRGLGRAAHEPMFTRSDEAFGLFFRLIEGIGLFRLSDVEDLTRTAPPVKTSETAVSQEYTIKYLTFHQGMTMALRKPDGLLVSVELLVNWSVGDLERAYGTKYKKRTIDGQNVFEFKKTDDKNLIVAFLNADGNIRSVRFTKAPK